MKSLFCLHLMGSHRRYTNRYPTEFNKFSINDIAKDISNEKNALSPSMIIQYYTMTLFVTK